MTRDIYYIVGIKEKYRDKLSLTTINREFCGKFHHEAHGVVWFELNGSGAWVAIPSEWIEWTAPSKVLWSAKEIIKNPCKNCYEGWANYTDSGKQSCRDTCGKLRTKNIKEYLERISRGEDTIPEDIMEV